MSVRLFCFVAHNSLPQGPAKEYYIVLEDLANFCNCFYFLGRVEPAKQNWWNCWKIHTTAGQSFHDLRIHIVNLGRSLSLFFEVRGFRVFRGGCRARGANTAGKPLHFDDATVARSLYKTLETLFPLHADNMLRSVAVFVLQRACQFGICIACALTDIIGPPSLPRTTTPLLLWSITCMRFLSLWNTQSRLHQIQHGFASPLSGHSLTLNILVPYPLQSCVPVARSIRLLHQHYIFRDRLTTLSSHLPFVPCALLVAVHSCLDPTDADYRCDVDEQGLL